MSDFIAGVVAVILLTVVTAVLVYLCIAFVAWQFPLEDGAHTMWRVVTTAAFVVWVLGVLKYD